MRRLWIGLGVMALLLAGCIAISCTMERVQAPISEDFGQAAKAALAQDWENARLFSQQAAARWKKFHRFTAAFADHTPMDEIDTLIAELEVYAQTGDQGHFAAICAHLHLLAAAFADSHALTWWNLL